MDAQERRRGERRSAGFERLGGGADRRFEAAPRTIHELAGLAVHQVQLLPRKALVALVENATESDVQANPYALLHVARALDPGQLLAERTAVLDRLAALVAEGTVMSYELDAERALDAARTSRLEAAEEIGRRIVAAAQASEELSVAGVRATEALGRALVWAGTDHASREGELVLHSAAEQYGRLGWTEAQAFALFWSAHTVVLQRGTLDAAEAEMRDALALLSPVSPRRAVLLTFYADVLADRGRWDDVTAVLDEAVELALRHDDAMSKAYVAWSRGRAASMRGDAALTTRWLVECERHSGDWFDNETGATFLADAAELLDRVGDRAGADEYLARAQARDPDDEFVRQARAVLLARRGDPLQALDALRELPRAPWLERRFIWRHTLFAAYATLRARRPGAGELAARALDEAAAAGGLDAARFGEPAIVAALAPCAAAAGSLWALEILAPGGGLVVRLIDEATLLRGGSVIELPVGLAGSLIRLLALYPSGLDVAEVLDALCPGVAPEIGRRQLRDARTRVGARVGAVVVRHGTRLRLDAGWVDVRAFNESADAALASRQDGASAVAALAISTGELLPTDPYADWAIVPRELFRRRRLGLLDLLAADAARAGRLDAACALLAEAIAIDPYDEARYVQTAEHLTKLGRQVAARRMLDAARARLDELGMTGN